jgi:hypothetical protein
MYHVNNSDMLNWRFITQHAAEFESLCNALQSQKGMVTNVANTCTVVEK